MLVKRFNLAAQLKIGLVEVLKDSIIAIAVLMMLVWYALEHPLIPITSDEPYYVAKASQLINVVFAKICGFLINFELEWKSIGCFYGAYFTIFVAPYFVAATVHWVAKILPCDEDYADTPYSVFHYPLKNSIIGNFFRFLKFFLDILVVKTPLALGAFYCAYSLHIMLGHISAQQGINKVLVALMPFAFVVFTGISQLFFIGLSYINKYTDTKNLYLASKHPAQKIFPWWRK